MTEASTPYLKHLAGLVHAFAEACDQAQRARSTIRPPPPPHHGSSTVSNLICSDTGKLNRDALRGAGPPRYDAHVRQVSAPRYIREAASCAATDVAATSDGLLASAMASPVSTTTVTPFDGGFGSAF